MDKSKDNSSFQETSYFEYCSESKKCLIFIEKVYTFKSLRFCEIDFQRSIALNARGYNVSNRILSLVSVFSREDSIITLGFYYSGPAGGPSHKMQPFSSPKGGSWSQAFHAWTVETGDKTSLFVSTVFCGEFFGKNPAFIYFDVTYKDVDRFRKGSVHEL